MFQNLVTDVVVQFVYLRNPGIFRIISAYENNVVKLDKNPLSLEVLKYGEISFPNFAKAILGMAEKTKCSDATSCLINSHVR